MIDLGRRNWPASAALLVVVALAAATVRPVGEVRAEPSAYERLIGAMREAARAEPADLAGAKARLLPPLAAYVDATAAELERLTGAQDLLRFRETALADGARPSGRRGDVVDGRRVKLSQGAGPTSFSIEATEAGHAERAVFLSLGDVTIAHAHDCVVFAHGDVEIGHARRCIVIAGGAVRIGHDGQDRRRDGGRSPRSWIAAGGEIRMSHAWGTALASPEAPVIAWESDVLRCLESADPAAAESRPHPERGVQIGAGPTRLPRRSFVGLPADMPRRLPEPAAVAAESRPESRPRDSDSGKDADRDSAAATSTRPTTESPQARSVREWAVIVRQDPDAEEIKDAGIRGKIAATGYPWLVRHEASGIEFVLIPPGEFMRGASPGDTDAESDEKPAHKIVIEKPFYLARTEVTNRQYRTKAAGHDSGKFSGEDLNNDSQPAVMVNWTSADEFCRSLGAGFRLPEEWEWEYACRAGSTTRYPWGDQWDSKLANSFEDGDGFQATAPVAKFPPNGFGLRDMIGNVWEWCATVYDASEYQRAKDGRPSPPASTSAGPRVLRGGSWGNALQYCRSSHRNRPDPSYSSGYVGFRPSRTLP